MKRVGHLFDRCASFGNLILAAKKAARGKTQKPHVARFMFRLEPEVIQLQEEIRSGAYLPLPYRCFHVYEPKQRYICAADFRDRVVHHAVLNMQEPVFERCFIHDSYACRKNKGTHRAVQRARRWVRRHPYFLKADVKHFFAAIDHDILEHLLERKFKDRRFLDLCRTILRHPFPGQASGKGIPVGNLTSQWWANLYLDALDHFIKDEMGVRAYLRYMDDFVIMAETKEQLHLLRADIANFLETRLKLRLKDPGTFIAPVMQGLPFLGFRIFPNLIRLKRENLLRFQRKMRTNEKAVAEGRMDEDAMIRSAMSLLGHVGHANTHAARARFFYGDR